MNEKPNLETACLDAIQHWSSLPQLAEFAIQRHGYGDSNGGFGVTYPGDLDDYDRQIGGRFIPPGYVIIIGFWGPPSGYAAFVPEMLYLTILARVLTGQGFTAEAAHVQELLLSESLMQLAVSRISN